MSRLSVLLLLSCILLGCGNKGALYFPEKPDEVEKTKTETETPTNKD